MLTASSAVVNPAVNSAVETEQLSCASAAVVSSKKSKVLSDIVDTVVEDKICCTNDVVATRARETVRYCKKNHSGEDSEETFSDSSSDDGTNQKKKKSHRNQGKQLFVTCFEFLCDTITICNL